MAEYRPLSPKNKYYLPKETFLMVIHFCKQYPLWEEELAALTDSSKAITYDQDRVQTSGAGDSTADLAIKRAEISRKKDMIDQTAEEVGGYLSKWLIEGVCYGRPYYSLKHDNIPCGKDLYYLMRRKFYYEMAKKL